MEPAEIQRIVGAMRQATTMPKLRQHLVKHGLHLGASDEAAYLRALREHVARPDLRLFTYLRARDLVPFWELVAPDTGATVLYNERRASVWSFFRPKSAGARMRAFQMAWIEVVRAPEGWLFLEDWRWTM